MTENDLIPRLIASIRCGGPEADSGALTLGLLIERECTIRPRGDGDIRALIDPAFADRRLTEGELQLAHAELMCYIDETETPNPPAVWCLTKLYGWTISSCLIRIINRFYNHPDENSIEVVNVAVAGLGTAVADAAGRRGCMPIVRKVARHGYGEAKACAERLLEHWHRFEDR